jgi:hypothetical protein
MKDDKTNGVRSQTEWHLVFLEEHLYLLFYTLEYCLLKIQSPFITQSNLLLVTNYGLFIWNIKFESKRRKLNAKSRTFFPLQAVLNVDKYKLSFLAYVGLAFRVK